ncbi:DsbC/DsbD-like thiol-disulfide interchange protein [Pedobacter africanus]|uniref:DsbC/DsbD-like thiol-disulfide interchange protein n=1 Tax=Pedobacter africanus TaxID=151894 RepID=A0ACC6KZF8_9SPHI|nr:protein-disulfide reductase DsbD domain-containing protein [Pedobacter africanus]MDR6784499.1 DsbC/DsbD-like thiol-disulfide interchange protein [Pedobacter africanus]
MKKLIGFLMIFSLAGLCANAQSAFDKKIAAAVKQLECTAPDQEVPVTLNAKLLTEQDSMAVIVKVKMAAGWHIYQYVPSTMPYIPIEHVLKLPEGLEPAGKWERSKPSPSANDPGVLIYENEAVFIHKLFRKAKTTGIIQAGLYYQTCDLRQCLPPVEKVFDLPNP